MNKKVQKNTIYDHLFWIALFLYTDPGGFMTYYVSGRLFDYGILRQLKDMLPFFFATAVMAITVYVSIMFIDNSYLKLLVGGFIGITSYLLVNLILKTEELKELAIIINNYKRKINV